MKLRPNIERGKWHPHDQHIVNFTYEDGVVQSFDVRQCESPVVEFQAHEKSCTSVTFSKAQTNLVATCSTDETVKVWDYAKAPPRMICEK
jgi:WD40 repeat protein